MTVISRVSSFILALLVSVLVPSFAFTQSQSLTVSEIVNRIQQARSRQHDSGVAYTVTRQYQLAGAGAQKPQSEVVADINVLPPSQEDYVIRQSDGSDRGEKIVRKILDHETSMAGHHELLELSQRNYDFALLGGDTVDGHPCYLLQLTPKRDAVELVRGMAWVDTESFEVRRIDGNPAKNPSFWVKNIHITLDFGEMQGMWLQTSTRAVADIRLAGTHVLTSRATDLRTASINAQVHPAPTPVRRSTARRSIANSASWVAR
jgi:hypothetical protein